jgi:hypothetical protein
VGSGAVFSVSVLFSSLQATIMSVRRRSEMIFIPVKATVCNAFEFMPYLFV